MKRYTLPELLSGAKNGLVTLDSDYVLYSDLIAAIEEDNEVYRELHERLAAENLKLHQRVAELEAIGVNLQQQAALHYQARIAEE